MAHANPIPAWKSITAANSQVWKHNLAFLYALDATLAEQVATDLSAKSLVFQQQGQAIRCKTDEEFPIWISGKTSVLEEMKHIQETFHHIPANTTLILWIGSAAGFAVRGLIEWLRGNPKRKALVIEPALAHLRACLSFTDIRPGLETGRLHFTVSQPLNETTLFEQIDNFNLWGESNPQIYTSPGLSSPIPARDFIKKYLKDSLQQQTKKLQRIKIIQNKQKKSEKKDFSRILLIDCWPGAPQSVHIQAIQRALHHQKIETKLMPVSGYLLDLHPKEHQRLIDRTLQAILADFQPDLIISYAYHAPQLLQKELASVVSVPWVQVISNLCYYDTGYFSNEFTAVIERNLIPSYQKRGAKNTFFVPIMADYTASQPVTTDHRDPIVFVGNSLGLSLPEVQLLLQRWQKRDQLFKAIRKAESDLSHFDTQANIYDYLNRYPLPQVENDHEEYEIFRYLLCQATAARRKRLLESTAKFGLSLYGNWRDNIPCNSPLRDCLKGSIAIKEEPAHFEHGSIFINIHSIGHATGPNMRFFNVPGMGGFLLSDGHFEDYLQDGKDIVAFHSEKEMLEKIKHYLNHPDEMDEIRHNGHARVLKDWTYDKWIVQVFKEIKVGELHR